MNTMDCLVSVDQMLKDHEKLVDTMEWEGYTADPKTGKPLESILRELEHYYRLRYDGVVYEPLF